jgi:glycerophosphoryl diester phosphodiesterase
MKNLLFLSIALTILMGCQNNNTQPELNEGEGVEEEKGYDHNFDLQGHRGARGLYPENSMEGFLAAVDLQVNTIELDVVISKDGQVVVSHEPWISSTICWGLNDKPVAEGKKLNIYKMNYSDLTNYNCGSQRNPDFPLQARMPTYKPLLKEVLAAVDANAAALELPALKFNIEIKSTPESDGVYHPAPKEFCEMVLKVMQEAKVLDRVSIQSFDVRALQEMKILAPSVPVALLISETDGFEKDLQKLGFTPEIYSPNFHLVNATLVRACHQNGIKIIPWTVNEEEDMVDLLELGVDGLITDYPDVALTLKM